MRDAYLDFIPKVALIVATISSWPASIVIFILLLIFTELPWYFDIIICGIISWVSYDVARALLGIMIIDDEDIGFATFIALLTLVFSSTSSALVVFLLCAFLTSLSYLPILIIALAWYFLGNFVMIPFFAYFVERVESKEEKVKESLEEELEVIREIYQSLSPKEKVNLKQEFIRTVLKNDPSLYKRYKNDNKISELFYDEFLRNKLGE